MNRLTLLFGIILCGVACKPTPETKEAPSPLTVQEAAREIMHDNTCMLVSVDEHAMPYARVMDPINPDENFVVWLATNPRSRKVLQLEANPNVVLHYVDKADNGYVSLYGKAALVRDAGLFNENWKPAWDQFYPNKSTDCVLIKVEPQRLEVIHYRGGISGDSLTWQPALITF
ncbi:MAG: hypothetical protein BroJett042_14220 [Bacteroidota bacterium]|nr:MAG: hypothetical protein BroJett042_14220 [Bacteroidota bacterium]